MAVLSDEKWFWDLKLLRDITDHLNDLNTNFQGQQKLISDMIGAFRAFEMNLNLFRKQLEWKMITSVIFIPVIYFIVMDE